MTTTGNPAPRLNLKERGAAAQTLEVAVRQSCGASPRPCRRTKLDDASEYARRTLCALAGIHRDIVGPSTAGEFSRKVRLSRSALANRSPRLATVEQDRGHPHPYLVSVGIAYVFNRVWSLLKAESKPLGDKVLGLLSGT